MTLDAEDAYFFDWCAMFCFGGSLGGAGPGTSKSWEGDDSFVQKFLYKAGDFLDGETWHLGSIDFHDHE